MKVDENPSAFIGLPVWQTVISLMTSGGKPFTRNVFMLSEDLLVSSWHMETTESLFGLTLTELLCVSLGQFICGETKLSCYPNTVLL